MYHREDAGAMCGFEAGCVWCPGGKEIILQSAYTVVRGEDAFERRYEVVYVDVTEHGLIVEADDE
jgi:hypothetical protein